MRYEHPAVSITGAAMPLVQNQGHDKAGNCVEGGSTSNPRSAGAYEIDE